MGNVDTGSSSVDAAGKAMEEILSQVKRVSVLIESISTATEGQSTEIAQVSAAVGNFDAITQQNAALELVEQTAAASESLREQTRRLSDAVQVFR